MKHGEFQLFYKIIVGYKDYTQLQGITELNLLSI